MKLACYIKKERLRGDAGVEALFDSLRGVGAELYMVSRPEDVCEGTDALLSLGGDGTFLKAALIAVPSDIPILGVNFGRLGFLSEYTPDQVVEAVKSGEFSIEERSLLKIGLEGAEIEDNWMYALNETSISRVSASMLGINVEIDSSPLPTYWADGLLVATSSGSTAYSLSVGGPICTPDSKVLIVAPISPHNLNVRPLVVPLDATVRISLRSRNANAVLSMDNRTYTIPASAVLTVSAASRPLKRVRLGQSNFINALRSRLLWGEDVRNGSEMIF